MRVNYKLEIGKFENIQNALQALREAILDEELAFPLPGDEPKRAIGHLLELEALCGYHIDAVKRASEEE